MRYILCFLIFVLFFWGCTYDNTEPDDFQNINTSEISLNIPEDFDFSTHRTVNISISDSNDHVVYLFYLLSQSVPDTDYNSLRADEVILDGIIYKIYYTHF